MAALPPIKRISKEDLADAPSWVDKLLFPLNQFLSAIYTAFNGSLTLDENVQCQIKTLQINAGAAATDNTASFALSGRFRPRFFLVTAILATGGDSFNPTATWNSDGVNFNVTSITGLSNGSTYDVTILLI